MQTEERKNYPVRKKSVYFTRAGNRARLFLIYSEEKKWAVEKIAESNKAKEQEIIDNLKQRKLQIIQVHLKNYHDHRKY